MTGKLVRPIGALGVALLLVACSGSSSDGGGGAGGIAAGGSSNGGSNSGGTAGQAGSSANGGSSNGGSANGGTSTGGTSTGGGGSSGASNCTALYEQAAQQLTAAEACNSLTKITHCTGTQKTTCGCEVPVESNDSAETKAYAATLAAISAANCHQLCPQIACLSVHAATCVANADSTIGHCMSMPILP